MYYCCQSFGHNVTCFEALGLGVRNGWCRDRACDPILDQARFRPKIWIWHQIINVLEIDIWRGAIFLGIQMDTRRLWFKKLVENSHMLAAGIWCPNMPWHLFRGIDHLRCTSFWKQISLERGNTTDEWMFATGKILTGPRVRTATEKGTGSSPVFYIWLCRPL